MSNTCGFANGLNKSIGRGASPALFEENDSPGNLPGGVDSSAVHCTIVAHPQSSVSHKIVRRMGKASEAQATRRVRRVVKPWHTTDIGEECVIDVRVEKTGVTRRIHLIIGDSEIAERRFYVREAELNGRCWMRSANGWIVNKSIAEKRGHEGECRIRNVALQFIADSCS